MEIQLTGRKAPITGGSKGASAFASARTLRRPDVAIMARRHRPLDEAVAARQGASRCSGRLRRAARRGNRRGFVRVTQAFGHIDILVNNAGTSNAHPLETITDAQWREDFDLKLFAAIRLTRIAWQQMKERKWGGIINVLEQAGIAKAF
jgi:NAD(P)-dependent dehydrogenase (short-subunit alcohol dehydrogenase family)